MKSSTKLGLGVVFHHPFQRVASQREIDPGMLVFFVLVK